MIYDSNDHIDVINEVEYELILDDPHPDTPEI